MAHADRESIHDKKSDHEHGAYISHQRNSGTLLLVFFISKSQDKAFNIEQKLSHHCKVKMVFS